MVKGSNYMETLAQTKYVVFDKTGTMTQGVFEVSGVHHSRDGRREASWNMQPCAESSSSHPISKSLQRAYGKDPLTEAVWPTFRKSAADGVTAKVDGTPVAAGNAKLMKQLGNFLSGMPSGRNRDPYGS